MEDRGIDCGAIHRTFCLVDARLLVLDDGKQSPTVEVAHEALIRKWPKLRAGLDEDRAGLVVHRRVKQAAQLVALAQNLKEDPTTAATLLREPGHQDSTLWSQSALDALQNGIAEIVLRGHEDKVSSVAFSPDGKKLVTGSGDQTARIWMVASDLLLEALWKATNDCLPERRRQELLAESPADAKQGQLPRELF